ncbi:hypothetical protein Sta7437_4843 (plasmid) [Stanieria cyanosphaera PCC 7437]|uniref:Uncharacterized protein n=1 Tax=Stanieria cyanosphaera (strain ATCC 29371 / PCC 7437) TaxID=111780 RepID=K9Y1J3_STAC7|nr:hypothetical protein [Stanieria cyanosphaera]AFZ38276.1 hypothetical protein Sta7437_4843 [Stanieria cyanosphaera PCC 7437]
MKLNSYQKLGLGFICLLSAGYIINSLLPPPSIVVLIDTSYCQNEKWQQVSQRYEQLYNRDRRRQLKIESVILANSLGTEEIVPSPPPSAIAKLATFGTSAEELDQKLQFSQIQTEILTCPP